MFWGILERMILALYINCWVAQILRTLVINLGPRYLLPGQLALGSTPE